MAADPPAAEFPVRLSLADLLGRLPLPATAKWPTGVWDAPAFADGTVSLVLFAPRGADHQTPHDRHECYVVVRGAGEFRCGDARVPFGPGDVLFAPAGADHRFERFSDDLVTWVVFWGP